MLAVIEVRTWNPTPTPEPDLEAGHAYDTPTASLYASGGFGTGFAANLALYGGDQEQGWDHNVTTGTEAFNKLLLWRSDQISVDAN
jgi:hypothetical protein